MSWAVVRIRAELLPHIDEVVEQEKDEFGTPKFRSRQEVVSKAVKEFLKELAKEAN